MLSKIYRVQLDKPMPNCNHKTIKEVSCEPESKVSKRKCSARTPNNSTSRTLKTRIRNCRHSSVSSSSRRRCCGRPNRYFFRNSSRCWGLVILDHWAGHRTRRRGRSLDRTITMLDIRICNRWVLYFRTIWVLWRESVISSKNWRERHRPRHRQARKKQGCCRAIDRVECSGMGLYHDYNV